MDIETTLLTEKEKEFICLVQELSDEQQDELIKYLMSLTNQ